MRFQGTCFRAHEPRFAWSPLSGEGAQLFGGRFNIAGVPALYLALTVDGMFAEMGHGFARRFEPLTICTYDVDVSDMADLRTDALRSQAGVTMAGLACSWKLEIDNGKTPYTWTLARRLIASGTAGILVPSFATGAKPNATNLVLWKWGAEPPYQVRVHDPSEKLPKDGRSWE